MKKIPEWDSLDIPSDEMLRRRAEAVLYNEGYVAGLLAGRAESLADGSSLCPHPTYNAYNVRVSGKLIARMQGCRCLECKAMVSLVAKEGK